MYAYIQGKLTFCSPSEAIVEAAGIGYRIGIPTSLFGKLPQLNEQIRLYTSFIVREQSQNLYGFLLPEEKELFEALMGVSGIGPKIALAIMSHLDGRALSEAVKKNDIVGISRVPGIGKKTAERLIIEMRDKLKQFSADECISHASPDHQSQKTASDIRDAMNALINLGYTQAAAQKAIKKSLGESEEEYDLATLITSALKNVS